MNKFRVLLISGFLIIYITSNAQVSNGNRDWIIKGNVTSLFDYFTFPTTRLSVEKRISNCFSINLEAGIQLFKADTSHIIRFYGKGYKLNIECRYYLNWLTFEGKAFDFSGFYIGLQGFVRQNKYISSVDYQHGSDTTVITDFFGVKKTGYGINFLMGFQFPVYDRIIFDIYGGIGRLNRNIINTDREFKNDEQDQFADHYFIYNPNMKNLSEGSGKLLNLICGIRVGYIIK